MPTGSSTRAAPAKNRIWSSAGGISSVRVSSIGLPVFSHSAAMISSLRASSASANFRSILCRSLGVVSRHESKAVLAAAYARSTSSAEDTGAEANTSPVAGLTRSARRPSTASTSSPLMKLRTALITDSVPVVVAVVVVAELVMTGHSFFFVAHRRALANLLDPAAGSEADGRQSPSARHPRALSWAACARCCSLAAATSSGNCRSASPAGHPLRTSRRGCSACADRFDPLSTGALP